MLRHPAGGPAAVIRFLVDIGISNHLWPRKVHSVIVDNGFRLYIPAGSEVDSTLEAINPLEIGVAVTKCMANRPASRIALETVP
jgi:hypothetical protein